jgi:hypothetical protein
MPIYGRDLQLLDNAISPIEQLDRLRLTEEVAQALERAQRGNTGIFEQRPDLAAAAYYLLNTSPYATHGGASQRQQTLDALRATIHQAMAPSPRGYSSSSILAAEFRLRALMYESPAAFYGLVDFVQHSDSRTVAGMDRELQNDLLGNYRFDNRTLLGIFGLLDSRRDPGPNVVRTQLLVPQNLARFDQMVRDETATPAMPRGVSIEEGIRILFVNKAIQSVHREMVRGIRYSAVDMDGLPVLTVRSPGSGIRFFMELNSSQKTMTEELATAYAQFRDTDSGLEALEAALERYVANTLGRRLPMEEIWSYLRRDGSRFPVRAAVIEALRVRPAEFDEVMTRAGEASVLREWRQEDREKKVSRGKRKVVRGR